MNFSFYVFLVSGQRICCLVLDSEDFVLSLFKKICVVLHLNL